MSISCVSRGAKAAVLLPGLLALVACGQSNGGTTAAPTTSNCSATACTVSYPAKARNGQASTGGPGIAVLGIDTQLVEIGQGAVTIRIGTAPAINVSEGQSGTSGGLSAMVTSLTPTQAVVTFKKA